MEMKVLGIISVFRAYSVFVRALLIWTDLLTKQEEAMAGYSAFKGSGQASSECVVTLRHVTMMIKKC